MKLFFRHSLRDFRNTWKKVLLFESIYTMATSLFFAPALAFALNRFLLAAGSGLLLNGDVYRVALSLRGLGTLVAIGFAAGLLVFLEFGTVIVVAQQRLFGRDAPLADAFATAVRAVPRLLGLGFIQWVLLLFTFSPWIDTPLSATLFRSVHLPITLLVFLQESKPFLAIYVTVLAIVGYLFFRCIFALHYILIDGLTTAGAIRRSFLLTRKRQGKLVFHLAALNAAFFASGAALLGFASSLLQRWEAPFVRLLSDWYVSGASFVALVLAMLTVPFNLVVLTRLFYIMRRANGEPLEDRLRMTRSRVLRRLERRLSTYFRNRSIRFGLALLALVYGAAMVTIHQTNGDRLLYLDWHTKVIGHRGDLHAAPENTVASIRSAIDQGVDAVEIDVQMSKDGIVVLNHDYTLERVAGVPASVHELTFAELNALDIRGVWTGMQAERIATLQQALQEAKGRTKLVVEIKPYGEKRELALRTAELIAAEDMTADVYVQSFDAVVLSVVRQTLPDVKLGQILFAAAGNVSTLDVDFYTVNLTMLTDRFLQQAHALGREVWVWTVNSERSMREALTYDVDGIITDYPARLRSLIGVAE